MSDKAYSNDLFDAVFAAAARQAALDKLAETAVSPEDYHTFSSAYEKRKQSILRRHRARVRLNNTLSATKKVAIIALVVLGIAFGGLMTVEAVRNEIISVIVEWFDKFSTVGFVSEDDTQAGQDIDLREAGMLLPCYIPDGYELVELDRNISSILALYSDSIGRIISYEQLNAANGDTLSLDNEHHEIASVLIHGYDGILALGSLANPYTVLIWSDSQFSYTITGLLDEAEIMLMAESLQGQ